MTRLTPIRSQYLKIKQNHLDAILLFRMGDFYETFDADAELASKILDITLTSKEMGKGDRVPLAGIPYHSLDGYLAKLIKAGHKVAICDQIGKVPVKGLVEREVVRIVTPGTVTESSLLEQKYNNYLASVVVKSEIAGLSYVDISTGEFLTTEIPIEDLAVEIDRIAPAELITTPNTDIAEMDIDIFVTKLENPEALDPTSSVRILLEQFGVSSLEGFGCDDLPMAIWAASNLITYLSYTQNAALSGITGLRTYHIGSYMKMDRQTHQTLELFTGGRKGESSKSLVSMIDLTHTPSGGRLLRSWIGQPLLDLEALEQRQIAVDNLYHKTNLRKDISNKLNSIPDIERILSKIVTRKAIPRELVSLKNALNDILKIKADLVENDMPYWTYSGINPSSEVISIVEDSLEDYPAANPSEGRIIRRGLSEDLDNLRDISQQSRKYISGLEAREKERTGIKSLKVGYNRVFGYYIEISRSNLSLVPSDYSPRQTLVGGERFITPELKEYESILLNAHEEIEKLESLLYENICSKIVSYHEPIVTTANSIARLDVLTSFAEGAYRYQYIKPKLSKDDTISIQGGRHPIVERTLPHGSFVPNDTLLSNQQSQLMILTGPNMSGKSTYIKQTALIVLMSQIGSFVPAESASIGLVDRIFTRAGLQDDLYAGQSTFMVEMTETANILRHATPKSLVILDEIGRGTSTYDGLAIARAVAEHIHNNPGLGCKTMFATHYHELIALTDFLPRIHNQNVEIVENGDTAIFLHRILPGGSSKSYGVHVAQLAGLPSPVITRAKELLWELENNQHSTHLVQKPLFELVHPLVDELKHLNLSDITPMQALNILFDMQNKVNDEEY